jgi:hypothetical protein
MSTKREQEQHQQQQQQHVRPCHPSERVFKRTYSLGDLRKENADVLIVGLGAEVVRQNSFRNKPTPRTKRHGPQTHNDNGDEGDDEDFEDDVEESYSTVSSSSSSSSSSSWHFSSFVQQRRQYDLQHPHQERNSVELKEERARLGAIQDPLVLLYLQLQAAFKILFFYLISMESILGMILTAGMTVFWYWYSDEKYNTYGNATISSSAMTENTNANSTTYASSSSLSQLQHQHPPPQWNGDMSLVLVTFAVASPITLAIRVAFDRREKALERIANIRAYFQHIYLVHAVWDWDGDDDEHCYHDKIKSSGRARCTIDFLKHTDMVLEELIAMGDELARFLSLPNTSRGWNRTTTAGRAEAARTVQAAYGLLESITIQRMARLTVYSERLKRYGLSGSEMSRVRSFERHLSAQLEELRLLKMYRTPQALWSFARIFTLILPPFYGPTFAQVAHQTHCIYVGIMFGMVTSLILAALLEAVQVLEDPFTAFVTLDGIDVREECKCCGPSFGQSISVSHSAHRSIDVSCDFITILANDYAAQLKY